MPDAKRSRDLLHSAKLLDEVHEVTLDTIRVSEQGAMVACVVAGSRHHRRMPKRKITPFNEAAGRRLAAVREALGLDQYRLAKELGVSRSTIANYEQGKRSLDPAVISRLWERWRITTDYIYRGDYSALPHSLVQRLLGETSSQLEKEQRSAS